MAQGCLNAAQALIAKSLGGTELNTAFIEKLNATFRFPPGNPGTAQSCFAPQFPETLTPLMFLMGCVYNFCTVHKSLRLKLFVGRSGYRWVQRTPALAAGLTDHIWCVKVTTPISSATAWLEAAQTPRQAFSGSNGVDRQVVLMTTVYCGATAWLHQLIIGQGVGA